MSKVKIIIIAVIVIFMAAIAGTVYVMRLSESRLVEVVQDGKVIYTFDLSTAEDQTITVISTDGSSSNTITICGGQISMSDAECPDKTCVKTGVLRSESIPIVCLPNKLIIRFCDEEE